MNLNYLQCFLTLAETLSFTVTADRLGLTQPSVSRQIKILEEELKTSLFFRDKREVRLTPEGLAFKTDLTPLLEQIQAVFTGSNKKMKSVEGSIKFGCLPEIGQNFFMSLLIQFQKKYSEIDIQSQYILDEDTIHHLKAGLIDVGVLKKPVISENIRTYKLLEERSVLVTRSENAQKISPIEKAYFIGYSNIDQLLIQYIKENHLKIEINEIQRLSTANSHKSMIELLLSRDSFAVLPYFSVRDHIQKGKLKIVSDKEMKTTIYLAHRESESLPKRIDTFIKFLIHECKDSKML